MGRKVKPLIIARSGDSVNPLLAALEHAGFDPESDWERSDSEAALAQILGRGGWQILIYQWGCGVPIDRVRAAVAEHAPDLPIVIAMDPSSLAADVARALGVRKPA